FSSPFPYTTLFRSCTPRFTRAISQSSSGVRQHAVQAAGILGADVVRLPQVALPLGRLLGEDVAAVGVAGLELAGRGLAESLGRTAMGLDLGHCGCPFGFCHWPGRWLGHAFRPARTGHAPRTTAWTGARDVSVCLLGT